MLRKEFITLIKIRDHAQKAVDYCMDIDTSESFEAAPMAAEASAFNMMQIGELAHDALSEETKALLPEIPWNAIYGLRNRIVHGYADVDNSIVFRTIKEDLPVLISSIDALLL